MRGLFGVRSGSVRGLFGIRSESARDPFGVRLGSVRGPFGVYSGSIWGPLGLRSGQFWTEIPGAKNFKISKIFALRGRRRHGDGPLAAVLSPAARRAPATVATAAQIENVCEHFSKKSWNGVGMY